MATVRIFNEQLPLVGRVVREALTDLSGHAPAERTQVRAILTLDGHVLKVERLEYDNGDGVTETPQMDVFVLSTPPAEPPTIELAGHHFGKVDSFGTRHCKDAGCNAVLKKAGKTEVLTEDVRDHVKSVPKDREISDKARLGPNAAPRQEHNRGVA